MKLRQFLPVLGLVALVAVIYSPSTLSLSASPAGDGGTAPTDTSASGTSLFLAYLHQSGYHVTVANDSQQVMASLQGRQRLVYLLVGADTALSSQELSTVTSDYRAGQLSALIAEGNTTNEALLRTFGAFVSGGAIVDPASPFQDDQVFLAHLMPPLANATGVDDVASPIQLAGSPLKPVAASSPSSYDTKDSTVAPRTVVAAGSTGASRIVLISDSGPFTNFLFNYTNPSLGVNETAFVAGMLGYVDPGRASPVLLDASHYNPPPAPKLQLGLPIGPFVAYIVEQSLAGLNSYYASFPSEVSGFLGGYGLHISDGAATALVALIVLISVYGALARWFAPEKRGRDDRPVPEVERSIAAESEARIDFLQTSRSKEGYTAALAQLYELLDSIVLEEFGSGISSVEESALARRVGDEEARRAKRLFLSLSRLREYHTGARSFLFPPVVRWRALTERTTREAEEFLNRLGITIAGAERPGQRMDVIMRERARA